MNFSRTTRMLSWITSHPGCKAHPWTVPVRVLQWEWYRMRRRPIILPLFDFIIESRPRTGWDGYSAIFANKPISSLPL